MARTSEAAVKRATGRDREGWFARLDRWGAARRPHREIAAWLRESQGVASWWAQTLTVDYEHARGLRAPGGSRDGTFAAGASKTIAAPVDRLFAAFTEPRFRKRWLPDATLRVRTSQPGKSARFDWEDGGTRVAVWFTARGESRSHVALVHERLSDATAAKRLKTYWRERLSALQQHLETKRGRS
jgi:hypothetical protein